MVRPTGRHRFRQLGRSARGQLDPHTREPYDLAAAAAAGVMPRSPANAEVASGVTVEDARLGQAGEAFLDGSGAGVADPVDGIEVVGGGPHDLLQAAEPDRDA